MNSAILGTSQSVDMITYWGGLISGLLLCTLGLSEWPESISGVLWDFQNTGVATFQGWEFTVHTTSLQ